MVAEKLNLSEADKRAVGRYLGHQIEMRKQPPPKKIRANIVKETGEEALNRVLLGTWDEEDEFRYVLQVVQRKVGGALHTSDRAILRHALAEAENPGRKKPKRAKMRRFAAWTKSDCERVGAYLYLHVLNQADYRLDYWNDARFEPVFTGNFQGNEAAFREVADELGVTDGTRYQDGLLLARAQRKGLPAGFYHKQKASQKKVAEFNAAAREADIARRAEADAERARIKAEAEAREADIARRAEADAERARIKAEAEAREAASPVIEAAVEIPAAPAAEITSEPPEKEPEIPPGMEPPPSPDEERGTPVIDAAPGTEVVTSSAPHQPTPEMRAAIPRKSIVMPKPAAPVIKATREEQGRADAMSEAAQGGGRAEEFAREAAEMKRRMKRRELER